MSEDKKVGGLNSYLRRDEDIGEPPVGLWNTLKYLGPGFILVASIVGSGGFIAISNAPGIGIELALDAREKFPPKPRSIQPRLHKDGSVVDQ